MNGVFSMDSVLSGQRLGVFIVQRMSAEASMNPTMVCGTGDDTVSKECPAKGSPERDWCLITLTG